jgi:hypothetical protein
MLELSLDHFYSSLRFLALLADGGSCWNYAGRARVVRGRSALMHETQIEEG